MFGRTYKYFISYWYQLDNKKQYFGDGFITTNKKIKEESNISLIRSSLKNEIKLKTGQDCNCVIILNIKEYRRIKK